MSDGRRRSFRSNVSSPRSDGGRAYVHKQRVLVARMLDKPGAVPAMDRFLTAEELQKEYSIPPQLFSKLRSDLPTAYHDEDGTTYFLESAVDTFLQRWASGQATPSPFLTAKEAAAYLRTTVQGIYSLVKRGKLPPLPGRRTLTFTREALDKYLLNRRC